MIRLNSCPRCHGAVLEYTPPSADSAMCINCGWRRQEVPPDIQEQVQAHLGKAVFEGRYAHTRIGTGKPPLSGWDRVKRSRERARRLDAAETVDDGNGASWGHDAVAN